MTYKDLGFTKTARFGLGGLPSKGVKGILGKVEGWIDDLSRSVDNSAEGIGNISDKFHILHHKITGKHNPTTIRLAAEKRALELKNQVVEQVKKPGFGRGLAVGVGVGTVGALALNNATRRKNNSVYYPTR